MCQVSSGVVIVEVKNDVTKEALIPVFSIQLHRRKMTSY